jgi:hypothetical protein
LSILLVKLFFVNTASNIDFIVNTASNINFIVNTASNINFIVNTASKIKGFEIFYIGLIRNFVVYDSYLWIFEL